jgi:hypothetical protein
MARRKSALPELPAKSLHMEVMGLSNIMKQSFLAPIREQLHAPSAFWQAFLAPDPWDEAVQWIERKHAAEQEWPWPARS